MSTRESLSSLLGVQADRLVSSDVSELVCLETQTSFTSETVTQIRGSDWSWIRSTNTYMLEEQQNNRPHTPTHTHVQFPVRPVNWRTILQWVVRLNSVPRITWRPAADWLFLLYHPVTPYPEFLCACHSLKWWSSSHLQRLSIISLIV